MERVSRVPDLQCIDRIIETVSDYYGESVHDLRKGTRPPELVHVRQVCWFLMSRFTKVTKRRMGRIFGGYDHTTVLHGLRKIAAKTEESDDFDREIEMLAARVKMPAAEPQITQIT